jgi:glyoxylase-like metal-dependent hydrolase (beta-lactamase superfamily II)
MDVSLNRRDILTAAGAALLAGAVPRALAEEPSHEALTTTDLGGGLTAISGAGANVVVAAGSDALLLVDGGSPERSAALLELVAQRWPEHPVRLLFDTNWRPEHTGSNETLGAAGTKIMAHENTKLWLGGDFFVEWENRRYKPRPKAALPTDTFYQSGSLDFRSRRVDYLYLPRAHTDGDVAVLFPDSNVLAASDLLAVDRYPIVDYATGGWIGGLEAATQSLLKVVDARTRIVPAIGPVCGRTQLEAQLTLCKTVRERVADAFRHGMSLKDFIATGPTREFDAERGDPSLFLRLVYKGAWAHVRELGGII